MLTVLFRYISEPTGPPLLFARLLPSSQTPHPEILPHILLQPCHWKIRARLGRHLLRVLLDYCLYRAKMRGHELHSVSPGRSLWHQQEKGQGSICRTGMDPAILCHVLEHRHVHHVLFGLLAGPEGTLAKLAHARDGRALQVVLPSTICILATANCGGQH